MVKERVISKEGLLFWEYCLDQMLFDRRFAGYGTAEIDFGEVMALFHVTSLTSVRTWYNELIQLGLVKEVGRRNHVLEITNCDRYISGGNGSIAKYGSREFNQSIEVIKQSIGLISQSTDRNPDNLVKSEDSKALSSFKVSLIPNTKQLERTMEEYQSIYREGSYTYLLPDDMAWVDRHQNFSMVTNY